MNHKTKYLIILIIIYAIYKFLKQETTEGFNFSYDLTPRDPYCLDCYKKNSEDCLKCGNCGISQRGPFSKCVPGDEQGPYFQELSDKWTYRDHNKGKTDTTPVTTESRPWNWFYPQTEMTRWSSPVFRATL